MSTSVSRDYLPLGETLSPSFALSTNRSARRGSWLLHQLAVPQLALEAVSLVCLNASLPAHFQNFLTGVGRTFGYTVLPAGELGSLVGLRAVNMVLLRYEESLPSFWRCGFL